MSADLHIHIFEGIDEDDLAVFESTSLGSKYSDYTSEVVKLINSGKKEEGSKLWNINRQKIAMRNTSYLSKYGKDYKDCDAWDISYQRVSDTPSVWVGEVSWLKAALAESGDDYVPESIGNIHEIIGEDLPVIDSDLIAKIEKAMIVENKTGYSLSDGRRVIEFLEAHKGKKCFTVSW